ncbi:radical SAM protein [Streptomyces specialis]|uniref:radical SAM protein n=1 Tax=Streptomyces specialis TaxID=498367 RepID=UPI00073F033A|nr:radical SAM protein [Streptomyces specialis]
MNRTPFEEELAAALTDESLHLIVLPTEQCNFRCVYCYEDFAVGRMRPATVEAVKRLIDRRLPGLRSLDVSWFGGEPLLARAVVEDVSAHITASAAGRDDLRYAADMTTNGYLLDEPTAARLAALGVRRHQISLDGPPDIHDTTRVRADGGGSFHRIRRNLLSLRDSALPIRIMLRVHLTPANLPSMPGFLAELRDTFLGDERFSVHLKPVERMGGPNDAALDILPGAGRAEIHGTLAAVLGPGAAGPPARSACYAARPNSLVIRADGTLGKCTVALSDPANTIGRLLPDGTLDIDNERLSPWLRGWAEDDWSAVGCPWAGMPRRPERSREPVLIAGPAARASRR